MLSSQSLRSSEAPPSRLVAIIGADSPSRDPRVSIAPGVVTRSGGSDLGCFEHEIRRAGESTIASQRPISREELQAKGLLREVSPRAAELSLLPTKSLRPAAKMAQVVTPIPSASLVSPRPVSPVRSVPLTPVTYQIGGSGFSHVAPVFPGGAGNMFCLTPPCQPVQAMQAPWNVPGVTVTPPPSNPVMFQPLGPSGLPSGTSQRKVHRRSLDLKALSDKKLSTKAHQASSTLMCDDDSEEEGSRGGQRSRPARVPMPLSSAHAPWLPDGQPCLVQSSPAVPMMFNQFEEPIATSTYAQGHMGTPCLQSLSSLTQQSRPYQMEAPPTYPGYSQVDMHSNSFASPATLNGLYSQADMHSNPCQAGVPCGQGPMNPAYGQADLQLSQCHMGGPCSQAPMNPPNSQAIMQPSPCQMPMNPPYCQAHMQPNPCQMGGPGGQGPMGPYGQTDMQPSYCQMGGPCSQGPMNPPYSQASMHSSPCQMGAPSGQAHMELAYGQAPMNPAYGQPEMQPSQCEMGGPSGHLHYGEAGMHSCHGVAPCAQGPMNLACGQVDMQSGPCQAGAPCGQALMHPAYGQTDMQPSHCQMGGPCSQMHMDPAYDQGDMQSSACQMGGSYCQGPMNPACGQPSACGQPAQNHSQPSPVMTEYAQPLADHFGMSDGTGASAVLGFTPTSFGDKGGQSLPLPPSESLPGSPYQGGVGALGTLPQEPSTQFIYDDTKQYDF